MFDITTTAKSLHFKLKFGVEGAAAWQSPLGCVPSIRLMLYYLAFTTGLT
jgi:hypothetical protein